MLHPYVGLYSKKKIENVINWLSESGTVNLGNIEILRNMLSKVNSENKNENIFADIEKMIEKAKTYNLPDEHRQVLNVIRNTSKKYITKTNILNQPWGYIRINFIQKEATYSTSYVTALYGFAPHEK